MAAKRSRSGARKAVKSKASAKPKAKVAKQARAAGKKAPVKAPAKKAAAKKAAPRKAPAKKAAPKKKARPALTADAAQVLRAAEVQGLISRLPPPVQPMVIRLRSVFLESAPEATELVEQSAPAFFARGVFARIEPQDRAVLVRFLRGNELPSAGELTEEGPSRTLLVSSVDELRTDVLRKLVREAVMLNLNHAPALA